MWVGDFIPTGLKVMTREADKAAVSHCFSQMWKLRLGGQQRCHNWTRRPLLVLRIQLLAQREGRVQDQRLAKSLMERPWQ